MCPRPYDLGKRKDQIDDTRRRVIDAARSLLADADTYTAFTIDAVAKRADVARATVYYQFGSKTGVLEALCDSLAEAGHLDDLAHAFGDPDPRQALQGFIAAFARFWATDRIVTRRLRALARLDPEVGAVIDRRDDRNRAGLAVLVARLAANGETPAMPPDQIVNVLHALTRFETFDALAGTDQQPTDVIPIITKLAEATLAQ